MNHAPSTRHNAMEQRGDTVRWPEPPRQTRLHPTSQTAQSRCEFLYCKISNACEMMVVGCGGSLGSVASCRANQEPPPLTPGWLDLFGQCQHPPIICQPVQPHPHTRQKFVDAVLSTARPLFQLGLRCGIRRTRLRLESVIEACRSTLPPPPLTVTCQQCWKSRNTAATVAWIVTIPLFQAWWLHVPEGCGLA